jgi:alpha-glucosidase
MPWEADQPNGGFTAGRPWLPVPAEHLVKAVDHQSGDASVRSGYRRFLAFRKRHRPLVSGDIAFLPSEGDVLAFLRTAGNEQMLCVFNFGPTPGRFVLPEGTTVSALDGHGFGGRLNGRSVDLDHEDAFFAEVT